METGLTIRRATYLGAAVALLCWPALADTSSPDAVPDLSAGGAAWQNRHNDFILPKTGAGPVTWDPAHPYFGNGDSQPPTSRVADLTNPILRSEEHTSELQSLRHLVCRLLLEKKKIELALRVTDRQHRLIILTL